MVIKALLLCRLNTKALRGRQHGRRLALDVYGRKVRERERAQMGESELVHTGKEGRENVCGRESRRQEKGKERWRAEQRTGEEAEAAACLCRHILLAAAESRSLPQEELAEAEVGCGQGWRRI